MPVAGVDIGSLSAKAVVLENGNIAASALIPTGPDSEDAARKVMDQVLKAGVFDMSDLDYIVSTGYGRLNVPFAHKKITEISCHAKGAAWFFPAVRTILDMGGQDCKAIRCGGQGKVTNFVLNDKCAAGTGRYLERIARLLGLSLEEIGPRSLAPVDGPLSIDSACAVFAENDVLHLLRQGKHVNDILAGAAEALVNRIVSLLQKVGFEETFSISGGVAKNIGIVRRLETRLGVQAVIAPEPQLVGAIGAALLARELTGRVSR